VPGGRGADHKCLRDGPFCGPLRGRLEGRSVIPRHWAYSNPNLFMGIALFEEGREGGLSIPETGFMSLRGRLDDRAVKGIGLVKEAA